MAAVRRGRADVAASPPGILGHGREFKAIWAAEVIADKLDEAPNTLIA